MGIIWVVMVLYFAIMLIIGAIAKKYTKEISSFFVGDRKWAQLLLA